MPMTQENATWFADTFSKIVENVGLALLGKEEVIRLALTAMLAEGHLLLEDAPGTGKTALARALAASVQGTHSRIQFTPDLLPSDITGVTVFDQKSGSWEFHPGPVFASIVLADEINRASPKTQSALLEVMEESKVTVDGVRHEAGRPFMVIATQNPVEQAGTYRLPEAQLDRFLMKTSVGYPEDEILVDVLEGSASPDRSKSLSAVIASTAVASMADLAATNHVERAVLSYIGALARATRESMLVLEAAGYDVVLVETVGVGQSEVAVAGMVDTFLFLHVARTGDQLQGIKRGILELADVISITKADGDNEGEARVSALELSIAMKLISSDESRRRPPVLTCSSYTGAGMDEVWEAVTKHRADLEKAGELVGRRQSQQRAWLWNMVEQEIIQSLRTSPEVREVAARVEADLAAEKISAVEVSTDIL